MKRNTFEDPRCGDVVMIDGRIIKVTEVLPDTVRFQYMLPPDYLQWEDQTECMSIFSWEVGKPCMERSTIYLNKRNPFVKPQAGDLFWCIEKMGMLEVLEIKGETLNCGWHTRGSLTADCYWSPEQWRDFVEPTLTHVLATLDGIKFQKKDDQ